MKIGIIVKPLMVLVYCRREDFVKFSENLDGERQTPSWLGLPINAEKVLLTNLGSDMCAKLMKVSLRDIKIVTKFIHVSRGPEILSRDEPGIFFLQ